MRHDRVSTNNGSLTDCNVLKNPSPRANPHTIPNANHSDSKGSISGSIFSKTVIVVD